MDSRRLSDIFNVYGRFHRSVQIQSDWGGEGMLDGYLPTPTAHEVLNLILQNLSTPRTERAFAISGPFGTGKSAFLMFLIDLLVNRPARHKEALSYQMAYATLVPRLLPVLIVGEQASLHQKLRSALIDAIGTIAPNRLESLRLIEDILTLYREGIKVARDAGWDGLLVVLDEFGKFLEFAALKPGELDVYAMQQLAEEAARSESPMLLITVQHSSIGDYLRSASDIQRTEWQKVQGRFKDITFLEPPGQLLALLSRSIIPDPHHSAIQQYAEVISTILEHEAFVEANRRFGLPAVSKHLAPLHPLTALLLVVAFRSQMAQNERSLFAFLTSREFFSFQQFLEETPITVPVRLYAPDRLYDYLISSLGGALYQGERSYIWRDIERHLERLPASAAPLAARVVKVVGLLSLYGLSIAIKADRGVLEIALSDAQPEDISKVLDELEAAQMLLYRPMLEAYVLWEGVHVDLEQSAKEAALQLTGGAMAGRLAKFLPNAPIVARAHYITRGTMRFYAVEYRDAEDAVAPPKFGEADGVISYILTTSEQERDTLIARYREMVDAFDGLWVVGFPAPLKQIGLPLREAEVWDWVQSNDVRLKGDEGARREVAVRLRLAQERLRFLLRDALNMAAIDWQARNKTFQFAHDRDFRRMLSTLCDYAFSDAPVLENELINRHKLSSAAVSARRILLNAMLTNETTVQLGLTKTPPEVSMYRSLLEAAGFHRLIGGQYIFSSPNLEWKPVWTAMEQFLHSTRVQRRPVLELYRQLKAPPFGLRDGPLPVLLLVLLLVYRREVALYEDGLFISEMRAEVVEQFTRNPDRFEIQQYTTDGEVSTQYRRLAEDLRSLDLFQTEAGSEAPLIGIVRALVLTVARLPQYTRLTRRFDNIQVAKVRDTILRAKDPFQLLHVDLPNVLDVSIQHSSFPEKLGATLKELIQNYPRLLDEIERNILEVFQLSGRGAESFERLRERAIPLVRYATDTNLSIFLREAIAVTPQRDRREALGRAIARGKPPMQWNDNDVTAFKGYLLAVASEFERLEVLVLEREKTGVQSVIRVDVLNGSLEGARAVVSVTLEEEEDVEILLSRLRDTLSTGGRDKIQLAALARLVHEALTRTHKDEKGV